MNKLSFIPSFFLGVLVLALMASACSNTQQNSMATALAEFSHDIDESLQTAKYLEFAGKVTDPTTGLWTNDYLVLFFLNGEEIARSTSHLGECESNSAFRVTIELESPSDRVERKSLGYLARLCSLPGA